MCGIVELVLAVEQTILDDQRQVELPGGQTQSGFFIVGNDQQPGQAVICLRPGALVGMGVKPVGPGAVQDGEFVGIALSVLDGVARVPVHLVRDAQAVPVDGTRFVDLVFEVNLQHLTAAQAQDRSQVAVWQVCRLAGGPCSRLLWYCQTRVAPPGRMS